MENYHENNNDILTFLLDEKEDEDIMLEYLEPKEKHQTKYIKIVPRRSFQSINASTLKKKRKLNVVHFSELTLNNLKQFEFLLSLVEMKLIIQPSNSQKVNIILLCYKKWDFFLYIFD